MNATDVIGWIVDGTYYCPDCTPSTNEGRETTTPVFGDSEADSFSHCATCEELIPERLTSDGAEEVIQAFERFLVRRDGRATILRQWATHLEGYWQAPEQGWTVRSLVMDATDEPAIKATKLNVARKVREILEPCEDCTNEECAAIRDVIKEIES